MGESELSSHVLRDNRSICASGSPAANPISALLPLPDQGSVTGAQVAFESTKARTNNDLGEFIFADRRYNFA
jgi:hypothetical protein